MVGAATAPRLRGWPDNRALAAALAHDTHERLAQIHAPTLIVHGDKDALVPLQQAQIMEAKMKEAGATCELIVKKGGGHDGALVKEHLPRAIDWFDKYLAKK